MIEGFWDDDHYQNVSYVYARKYKDITKHDLEYDACINSKCIPTNLNLDSRLGLGQPIKCSSCTATKEMTQNYKNYLKSSKFALIIHGDTPTTSRLYDAIANLQIPIIISPTIYVEGLPFINKVAWYDFCFFIDPFITNEDEVKRLILQISDLKFTEEYILQHKFEKMLFHREDVLWSLKNNKIVENIIDEAVDTCR